MTTYHLNQLTITEYEIQSEKLTVRFLNLGGAITKISMTADNENLVLTFDDYHDYLHNGCYLNTLIGRTSNRIKEGLFTINNKPYTVDLNTPNNNLHGGAENLSHVLFDVTPIEHGYALETIMPHQPDGFPGNLSTRILYEVIDDTFKVTFNATTDRETIVNFTQHLYFNLSGNVKSNILNHELQINADYIATVDENSSFTENVLAVENTCFDFRTPTIIDPTHKLTHPQMTLTNGYDHLFILSNNQPAAILIDPTSKRKMTLSTTLPSMQVYGGNFLSDRITFENNRRGEAHLGLALEAHYIPYDYNAQYLTLHQLYNESISFTFTKD